MQADKEDIQLLFERPFDLILKYQQVFLLIARKYACSGYYHFSHSEEIVQHVNERIFTKIDRIRDQFDGRVLVRTYLSAICRKIIMEYLRSAGRREVLLNEYHMVEDVQPCCYPLEFVIIEEFRRLDRIMVLFGPKRDKLWLMMKLLYRIRISFEDFAAVNPRAATMVCEDLLHRLNHDAYLKDRDIYQLVFPFFQCFEARMQRPDSLRKWFNMKISDIIKLMNGTPARASYAEDTIQILVEKYCDMVESGVYAPLGRQSIGKKERIHGYRILKSIRKR
jgi:hypothetical protein